MFAPTVAAGTATLAVLPAALAALDQDVADAERIDRIRLLEQLKAAAAAAQARETAAFAASQRAQQRVVGLPAKQVGMGIAAQVGLAKRMSPFHARRYTGWAQILITELPATYAALAQGRITEWRAMIVARETAWLTREQRAIVDAELAPRLEALGDRGVEAEAKRIGYRLDPAGALARVRGADTDRRVTIRPAPDTMARLTALLPVAQGVAAYAALLREADQLIGTGDGRSRGQLMADLLVRRLTGQATADAVPVEINLIMTDETLLDPGCTEPAHLDGHGPIPAPLARHLVLDPAATTPMWIRRLFIKPGTGELAAMETRRRYFTANQRHFLRLHDQHCRTPWCEAPIRHTDHVQPAEAGGTTSVANGQGACEACNYAKQAPGWQVSPGPDAITTSTPTGHTYDSRAPDPPRRTRNVRRPRSSLLGSGQVGRDLGAAAEPEFGQDSADVMFDRLDRQVEALRDVSVGSSLAEQAEHLRFAPGQGAEHGRSGRGPRPERPQQLRGGIAVVGRSQPVECGAGEARLVDGDIGLPLDEESGERQAGAGGLVGHLRQGVQL
jgi:hypothetical protein